MKRIQFGTLFVVALVMLVAMSASAQSPKAHAVVTWADNSDNETGFRVDIGQGLDPAAPEFVYGFQQNLPADTTAFELDLTIGTGYTLRIVAVNAGGETPSSAVSFTTPLPPPPAAPGTPVVNVTIVP